MEQPLLQLQYDDEIDLYGLFDTVWDGRWVIILITAIFVIIGGTSAYFSPKSYEGTLEILPATTEFITSFTPLNNIGLLGKGEIKPFITKEKLLDEFILQMRSYVFLRHAVKQFSNEYKSSKGDKDEKKLLSYDIAKNFKIAPPSKKENRVIVSFKAKDKVEAESILEFALESARKAVQKKVDDELEMLKASIKYSLANEAKAIEDEINLAIFNYDLEVAKRIAFLNEQAEIAHAVGIKENSLKAIKSTSSNTIGITIGSQLPFYLRGYVAIEKESSLLQNRNNELKELHVEGMPKLKTKYESTKKDRRIQELESARNFVPLNSPKFEAVVFDLSLIEYKTSISIKLIMVLVLLLGGMFSIFFVLIRSGYRKRNLK